MNPSHIQHRSFVARLSGFGDHLADRAL